MLKTRVFHKKSRRGRVRKVVRELYLRDDVPCGIRECRLCPPSVAPPLPSPLPCPQWDGAGWEEPVAGGVAGVV